MKKTLLLAALTAACSLGAQAQGLKDALGKYFLMGTAINSRQAANQDKAVGQVITDHFNTIVPENCMKPESVQPSEGQFDWHQADQYVHFGEEHGMTVLGHCLVWHSQTKDWMFRGEQGQTASRDLLIARMREHIYNVVGRYKGRIKGWDVVNEAINDDGTMRRSPWYNIIGPDFIALAFRFAHEADPDAELYYNDYSTAIPAKRDAICRLVRALKAEGLRIDAVGMQSHNGLDWPSLEQYEATMDSIAGCGVKVMITELDINVLPNPQQFNGAEVSQNFDYKQAMDPYRNGLPESVTEQLNKRWLELFDAYKRHAHQISRVTLWGVSDAQSWLNDWPIHGRTAYPLLFDRQYEPKSVVKDIIRMYQEQVPVPRR